jgi:hypothetical protein
MIINKLLNSWNLILMEILWKSIFIKVKKTYYLVNIFREKYLLTFRNINFIK